ncbi:DNA-directed RNA polymerase subunit alpha C-terminal domain-containing protein [Staphylococcus equorum]|uniref:DNA-directed RNA polymerase subunit alpha C-terminal domain-containing protein n=1 Tax=Staphylococcus equorum TaxID=246432 RepID=UPI0020A072C9|nr:DNA-directed RNA polymerase subunit alpha C-terminal domain-containing protein [Staphylococcus equorum]
MLISKTNLSVRSRNALQKAGYIKTEEIKNLTRDELANISNLGKKSIDEIGEFINLPSETSKDILSIRSQNALAIAGYHSIEEIEKLTENDLRNISNLGEKSIEEILNLKPIQKGMKNLYELHGLCFNEIKNKNIEILKMDNTFNKILKNNNVQTVGVFLELKKSDVTKFRGINDSQVLELKSIINNIRDELKLNYQDIIEIILSNPQHQVKETIFNSLAFEDNENVEFYFRFGEKLKKSIEINCIENKESDVKKISDLYLNQIDKLINVIPKNLKYIKGMNEKSVNRVLKVLTNKLVIVYKNEIVLEALSYNYLRNHSYKFWLNMEDDVLSSITNQIDKVTKKYVNINYHGFKELSYFISHNTKINKEIEVLELSTREANEIVYNYLKTYSKKLNYKSLEEKFKSINSKVNFMETVNNLIDEGLVILEEEKIITLKKSILYYAKRFKAKKEYEALKFRLKNYTLQEIGDEIGLTRERVRQLVNQSLMNLPKDVREIKNAYWFKNYNLDQSMYNYFFEDDAYNYLTLKYTKGLESWTAILDDEMADDLLKRKITNKMQENRIVLDEVSIPKNRLSVIRYLIKNYCDNITTHKELEEFYFMFLEDYVSNQKGFELEKRYIEARISDQDIVVERPKKRFRFYDYSEYDWELFYRELGLKEWQDMELSTEIIFNANKKLMDDFNILNKYELHNIMKRTKIYVEGTKIKFGRTPHLVIGEGNRENQVINLLFENAPIKKDDLAEIYLQTYGVNKATVSANYFDIIKDYQVGDTFVAKDIEINEDILDKLIDIVENKSLIFLEDIQKVIDIETSILTLYLNQLEFKKYSNYYISDKYRNITELFEFEVFDKLKIIDADKIDPKIWSLSSFSSQIYKKIYSMDIVEFDNNKFITIKKLNEIGLSKEIFQQFREEVLFLLQDSEFWSLLNILEAIDNEKIDEFGFNSIFYRSLLRGAKDLYNHRIGNNSLFKLGEPVSLKSFLSHLVNKKKIVNIYDLIAEIKEVYELDIEKHKIVEVIKKLGMYYDEIMEKIYFDIDYYYEEFL